ncbi:hypothetical protein HCJ66_05665 [Listeria sp. FSL L7-1582]|nr:hypothetical protein [Listeria portnoyi]
MDLMIEIATEQEDSNRDKGVLLEKLGKEILQVLQYEVIEEIRVTGMEVDLLAKHKLTAEEILVECKSHTANLSADVITKLVGNIFTRDVSAGWLMTTGPLGKDAKGIQYDWEKKEIEKRRKLQVHTPDKLLQTLISANIIVNPEALETKESQSYMPETVFLVSKKGKFWAKKTISEKIGIADQFELFNAESGKLITNEQIYIYVSNLESSFSNLGYSLADSVNDNIEIETEYENIVQVSSGDKWADYRPSRPKDFVGRDLVIKDEFNFYSDVLLGKSETRLTAIKAPSGWGKSSLLLKIKDRSTNKRNQKIFVCSVDLRAASSKRYAELALITCFNEAIKANFIKKPKADILINSTSNPFASEGIKDIFEQLASQNKLIVLYFDQFEEIFSKLELLDLFNSIRKISSAVDSAKENFILGYAWKTDGTIPTEHPAYNMWHMLKDRRFEKNLEIFTTKEITKALAVFSKELGQVLNPNVKRYLEDQCQGYPWLLKKLSIHVYETVTSGDTQENVITQGLDIGKLFEQDMMNLSPSEFECVTRIAKESPADFFKLDQDFGNEIIDNLLNKRIVIRKAHKLILYWDIFKDYVLTGVLPKIDITYVPQGNINAFMKLISILVDEGVTTITQISEQVDLGRKATENLLRDMIMFGNVSRKGEEVTLLDVDEKAAIEKVYEFFSNHIFMKRLREYSSESKNVVLIEFQREFIELYSDKNIQEKTLILYYKKILRWLSGLGLIDYKSNRETSIIDLERSRGLKTIPKKMIIQNKLYPFFGSAPASRLLELFEEIKAGEELEANLNRKKLRNAITTAVTLGFAYRHEGMVKLEMIVTDNDLELEIARRVLQTETIQLIDKYYSENSNLPSRDWVGREVSELLNKKWKPSSEKRNGSALLNWYVWSKEKLQ